MREKFVTAVGENILNAQSQRAAAERRNQEEISRLTGIYTLSEAITVKLKEVGGSAIVTDTLKEGTQVTFVGIKADRPTFKVEDGREFQVTRGNKTWLAIMNSEKTIPQLEENSREAKV